MLAEAPQYIPIPELKRPRAQHNFGLPKNRSSIEIRFRSALTRIIHEAFTAAADSGMPAALRSVGFLDVLSSTPAESSRRAGQSARCALHPCPSAPPRYKPS